MKTPIKIKGFIYKSMYNSELIFNTSPNLNASMGFIMITSLDIDTEFDMPEIDEKEQLKADIEKRIFQVKKDLEFNLHLLEVERRKLDED